MKRTLLLIIIAASVFVITHHQPKDAQSSISTPEDQTVAQYYHYLTSDASTEDVKIPMSIPQESTAQPVSGNGSAGALASETLSSELPAPSMVKIRVLSSLSNQPIPYVPIVTVNNALNPVKTDLNGFTELPLSYYDIYVPALHGFQGSETVDIATTAVDGMITFYLKPDLYPETLPQPLQPTPESLIDTVRSDTVRIQVIDKRTGKPLPRMTIAVANSSMHRVTNEHGYADLPLTAGNIYVPVFDQFHSSETFSSISPNVDGVIVVALEPDI